MWEFENLVLRIIIPHLKSEHPVWQGVLEHDKLQDLIDTIADEYPTEVIGRFASRPLTKRDDTPLLWDPLYDPGNHLWQPSFAIRLWRIGKGFRTMSI